MNKISILILSAFLLSGCNNSDVIRQSLKKAEAIMSERPDSALRILNSIDTNCINRDVLKAKYALLHSIALDKNDIDATDASILSPALSYYMKKGSVTEKVKTLYYLGCIQRNAGYNDAACVSLLQSLKLADRIDDYVLKGQICSAIGITYNNNLDHEDELRYLEQAHSWFLLSGDSLYIDKGKYALATAFHNNRLFDEADSLYSIVSGHGRFFPHVLLKIASSEIKSKTPDPERASCYFHEANAKGAGFLPEHWYQYAFSLYLAGRNSEAEDLHAILQQYANDPTTYWWQYRIAKKLGDRDKAIEALELHTKYSEEVVSQQLDQSIHKAEKNYYAFESERAENRIQAARVRFLVLLSAFVLSILTALFILSQRGLHHQKAVNTLLCKYSESQKLLSQANVQLSGLSETENKLANLRSSFISMYQSQFARIGELYTKNLDFALVSDKYQKAYSDQISSILAEIAEKNNTQFESRINMNFYDIMAKIRSDFPELGENNFRFLCFVIAGFKNSAIGLIMDMSHNAVRTRKSRLKKQLLSSNSINKDLYELFLE